MIKEITEVDPGGNKFMITSNGTVRLKMANENRARHLGIIKYYPNKQLKRIWFKKEKERDIHRKTNSWSIPYFMFEHIDAIVFDTAKKRYRILAEKAKMNGQFLYFQQSGFEKKIYTSLDHWIIEDL